MSVTLTLENIDAQTFAHRLRRRVKEMGDRYSPDDVQICIDDAKDQIDEYEYPDNYRDTPSWLFRFEILVTDPTIRPERYTSHESCGKSRWFPFEIAPYNFPYHAPGIDVTIEYDPDDDIPEMAEYFRELMQSLTEGWPDAVEQLQRQGIILESADDEKVSSVESQDEKSWEKIPDHNWDRQALELWWTGYTIPIIAKRLGLVEKTVRNRMTILRKTYGEEIVPTFAQLREMRIR